MSADDVDRDVGGEGEEIVEAVPVVSPTSSHSRLSLSRSQYISQLPSPEDIERYSAIEPGILRWLMDSGDREQAHRHQLENRLVELDEKAMPRHFSNLSGNRRAALILGVLYEAVMALAIAVGETGWGIGGAAVGVGAMVYSMRRDTTEPIDKSRDEDAPPGTNLPTDVDGG